MPLVLTPPAPYLFCLPVLFILPVFQAFSDLSVCRSIVLTSGTLSPINSFESELGVPFPIKLEANHVIEDKQVWVGAVGQGPRGGTLEAVYRSVETLQFQDELGDLVLRVCKVKGVNPLHSICAVLYKVGTFVPSL